MAAFESAATKTEEVVFFVEKFGFFVIVGDFRLNRRASMPPMPHHATLTLQIQLFLLDLVGAHDLSV